MTMDHFTITVDIVDIREASVVYKCKKSFWLDINQFYDDYVKSIIMQCTGIRCQYVLREK